MMKNVCNEIVRHVDRPTDRIRLAYSRLYPAESFHTLAELKLA